MFWTKYYTFIGIYSMQNVHAQIIRSSFLLSRYKNTVSPTSREMVMPTMFLMFILVPLKKF